MIANMMGVEYLPIKPGSAGKAVTGYDIRIFGENGQELGPNEEGYVVIKLPLPPGTLLDLWKDNERFKAGYLNKFPGYYFSGDGGFKDDEDYIYITGRVDDVVIVSGHNLGTAPIEDAINEHPAVAESAIVGFPHDVKGNALYGFITLKESGEDRNRDNLRKEINEHISSHIGPIAKLDKIQFVSGLPKTRSGKIMRRILRKIAEGDFSNFGDTSTLLNPEIVDEIKNERM